MRYPIIKVLFAAFLTLCVTLEGYGMGQPPESGAERDGWSLEAPNYELSHYINDAGEMLSSSYVASYTYLSETLDYLKEQGFHRDLAPLLVVTLSLFTYQIRQNQARLYLRAYMQNIHNVGGVYAVEANTAAAA